MEAGSLPQATPALPRRPPDGLTGRTVSGWEQAVAAAEFRWMEQRFAQHGGLASGDQVAALLREHEAQPLSSLARRIASRQLLHFVHRGALLIPMFQFGGQGLGVRDGVSDSLLELRDAFDDWELTLWFARPNVWLAGASPTELIGEDPNQVLRAARADLFVALG